MIFQLSYTGFDLSYEFMYYYCNLTVNVRIILLYFPLNCILVSKESQTLVRLGYRPSFIYYILIFGINWSVYPVPYVNVYIYMAMIQIRSEVSDGVMTSRFRNLYAGLYHYIGLFLFYFIFFY